MKKADFIIKSKAVFTGTGEKPFTGIVAVHGDKILAVERIENLSENSYENCRLIDVGDKLVVPGFIDAHVHYFEGAIAASDHMCDLSETTSEQDAVEVIKKFRETHPEETAIRSVGWFPATWGTEQLPHKKSLDEAFPDIPVYAIAADGHTFWCNSKALEAAGYTEDYQPPSGYLGKDENGELNGLIFEMEAGAKAMQKVREYPLEEMERVLASFNSQLLEYGVTTVSDMMGSDFVNGDRLDLQAAIRLDQNSKFKNRLHIFHKFIRVRDFEPIRKLAEKIDSQYLKISGGKAFVDGVSTTYTALLNEPYADRPNTCGIEVPVDPKEEIIASTIACNAAGFPVRLHADGDGAVRLALDAFEASIEVNGRHHLPNTIEHIETIVESDISRFEKLEVIASMQPQHMVLDDNEKVKRCGVERCKYEWAHRSLLDAGATIAFGSDYSVVHFNPFPTIHSAITRCDADGNPTGVNPEQKISLAEALVAYTMGAAKCYGREREIGSLEAGKLADIAVINCNLFAASDMEIHDAKVDMTILGGEIVYERK